jgi:hypothetical protein
MYKPNSQYTVYCPKCWWSEEWDPYSYGQEFDFNLPFFTQFDALLKKIPHLGVINETKSLVNSDYVTYTSDAKNCYLVFAANYLEDCMYSHYIWETKNSVDCSNSTKLELCYECVDCDILFNCNYVETSQNCYDCALCCNLKNCHHCFGCVNLRHKEYHVFNEPVSKEEYEKIVKDPLESMEKFSKFKYKFPRLSSLLINCENSTGDAIKNCKNCKECFEGYSGEDLRWVQNFPGQTKDSYDIYGCADLELALDCHAVGLPGYNIKYSNTVFNGSHDITYSAYIMNGGHDLFGCIALKKSEFCVLNKKYSKEDYETLLPKIIAHMKKSGEWGEFFPMSISPFKYEETKAVDYFPKN